MARNPVDDVVKLGAPSGLKVAPRSPPVWTVMILPYVAVPGIACLPRSLIASLDDASASRP
jgi:hypothetical protein